MVNVSQPLQKAFARTTGQQRKPWNPVFVRAKERDMRDFRDAKVMARILRGALAAKGLTITNSQSLELVAEMFGAADWNTLAAAIGRATLAPGRDAAGSSGRTTRLFSPELERTLHRALAEANHRSHEYATLEHLLLALIDDVDAVTAMEACKVDLGVLKQNVSGYIDSDLKALVTDDDRDSRPTAALQRVIRRALDHVQALGRDQVTGAELLAAMFDEKESPAVWFLGEQDVTQQDVADFVLRGIAKGGEDPAA
jgi:hypothetical protein